MHIGILTQPLRKNYGGLLQAWALQQILFRLGHDSTIINRICDSNKLTGWQKARSIINNFLYVTFGQFERRRIITKELINSSDQHIKEFRDNRYFLLSEELVDDKSFNNYISVHQFDAFIVGSDQVWRPKYSPNLMTYFLDFAKNNRKVKKIAYGASFGVDFWELTPEQSEEASVLAQLFDVITVRESSGVDLVKEYLNCDAIHVLDPTMLLNKEDYTKLIDEPTVKLYNSNGEMLCYIMNKSRIIDQVIDNCFADTNLIPFFCNDKKLIFNGNTTYQNNDCKYLPPVEQWLKSFYDSKMVITDSFHGVVFSIIFNKPFWVILNEQRGASRFHSLLEEFGLEDRIIYNYQKVMWNSPINWVKVNSKRSDLANRSIKILESYLQ